jgi:hypothetical protein
MTRAIDSGVEASHPSAHARRGAAARQIELLHPPDHGFPSGGNVYNRELVEAAKRRGVPLSSRIVQASEIDFRMQERNMGRVSASGTACSSMRSQRAILRA